MKLFSIRTFFVTGPNPYQLTWIAAVAWEGVAVAHWRKVELRIVIPLPPPIWRHSVCWCCLRGLPVFEEDSVDQEVGRGDVDAVFGADLGVVVADAAVDAAADQRDVGGAFDEEAEHVDVAQGDVVGRGLRRDAARHAHVADLEVVGEHVQVAEDDAGAAGGPEDDVAGRGLRAVGLIVCAG